MKSFIIVLLLFGFIYAQEHHEKNHWHYKKDLTYLGLSKNQKEKIKNILKEYRKDIKDYREKREEISKEKQKVFLENSFDEMKLKSINGKINKLATEIEIRFLKRVHAILSNEQRRKFVKYINEWDIE
ncbi:MAG: Spy/CpxP family protein refolding chaperone [Sulfurospirillaceae bacterium]|nr:Spy/CpxP family protein refolding chaperone [Sulfurospirillaceae bacterium]